jgi:hypothetical protein
MAGSTGERPFSDIVRIFYIIENQKLIILLSFNSNEAIYFLLFNE